MEEFRIVLTAVLPVFSVAGAGFGMRKLGWLTKEADQSLLRVTINLLVPCLIFDAVLGNKALENLSNVFLPPLIGFGTVALGVALGSLCKRWAGIDDNLRGRTFAYTVGIYNYGYVPLPLTLLLFNQETTGVLLVHNVGVEIALWTLGLTLLGGVSLRDGWRKLISPPLLMIVAALALNFAGGKEYVPEFALKTAKMLGQCAIPLGLVLVGATIADEIAEFHADVGWRVMGAACALRVALLPLCFLVIAKFLPCSTELKRTIVIQAAMPSAVFPIIMAKHYGGHTNTAVRVVMGTTVVSFLTIPLWIRFGMHWVGL